jgi:hydroxyacylglutathione hydrolase
MTMRIEQFRYAADNLAYLVFSGTSAIAIDPGAPDEMLAFARSENITIARVTNTHLHPDHTSGNARMLEKTGAEYIDCRNLSDNDILSVGIEGLTVIRTPGHTRDDVCFSADDFLVTGDTLFNGTVGNCFSRDLDAFYHSLKKLMAFPGATRIFAGHDYVMESVEIAQAIDPDTPGVAQYLESYDPDRVTSFLADELRINPFLRFNDPVMIRRLEQRNFACATEIQRFKSLMLAF